MEIILIAAMAANRVIGRNNTIPWHIPGEQKKFRETTWGHPLIMGRKTHESIGRPLPGRRNIVVSRDPNYRTRGCDVVHSLQEAYSVYSGEERIFNIGGAQLYRVGIDQADTLILTVLQQPFSGDAFFPDFSKQDFLLTAEEQIEDSLPYSVQTYQRAER